MRVAPQELTEIVFSVLSVTLLTFLNYEVLKGLALEVAFAPVGSGLAYVLYRLRKNSISASQKGEGSGFSGLDEDEYKALVSAIKNYKYVSPNLTLFERLWLNDFWGWWATKYPMWLAPNLITLIGFVFMTLATTLLFFFSPTLNGDGPSWWFLLAAICVFIYQTFDGSDGKQARRTGSGSALGELFDHGCDAIITTWIAAMCCQVTGSAITSMSPIIAIAVIQTAFLVSNLTMVHTGKQVYNDVESQESLVLCQVFLLFSFFLGKWWSSLPIPVPSFISNTSVEPWIPSWFLEGFDRQSSTIPFGKFAVNFAVIPVGVNIAMGVLRIAQHYRTASSSGSSKKAYLPARGPVNLLSQLFSQFLINAFFIGSCVLLHRSQDTTGPGPAVLVFGFTSSDLMFHILISRVCLLQFPPFFLSRGVYLMASFFFIHLYADYNLSFRSVLPSLRWAIFAFSVLSALQYTFKMGNVIASVLGIDVFKIKPKKKE